LLKNFIPGPEDLVRILPVSPKPSFMASKVISPSSSL
jgi:hypothetical protein